MNKVLTPDDYQTMQWKNGLGSTLEIARSHGQGLVDFDWRVSIADVNAAGDFSFFPNKKRIIGVLEGAGLTLHIDNKAPVTLYQKEFLSFDGESTVYTELLNGAIRDFNLIYNPDKYAARLQWQNTQYITSWISDADQILVFNASAKLKMNLDTKCYELNQFETLLIHNDGLSLQFQPESHANNDFCLIELFKKRTNF